MPVSIHIDANGISAGTPKKLFESRIGATVPATGYDVTADGKRFVAIEPVATPTRRETSELVLVEHCVEELRRQVPTGK